MWETYENVQETSLGEGAGVGPGTGVEQGMAAGTGSGMRGREISCESPDSPSGAAPVWQPAGCPAAAIALAIPCFGSFFLKTRSDEICKHRGGTEGFRHVRGRPVLAPRTDGASMILENQCRVDENAFTQNFEES